ncbi:MAG: ATP-binding protein [Acidobacteriota bacterium]|jgi:anti-sigma regulatory factor (Ser/Thr protein kinase)|nr:ATP-binding protein [Acidobacteriota bacterium]
MMPEAFESVYYVLGRDYANAGKVSTQIKDTLKRLGIHPAVVRRVAIVSYEAEMNLVMYATRGQLLLNVSSEAITLRVEDEGPGIPDIDLAMQEGWSTATPEMREMGFGAGMGLPNIRKNADEFTISSEIGRGTQLYIHVRQAT